MMDELQKLYAAATEGDPEAAQFVVRWHHYCHMVDDRVDDMESKAEDKVQTSVLANILYSEPFYQKHVRELHMVVILVSNAYMDSVNWAQAPDRWKQETADVLRFSGNEMILAVAFIRGGWKRVRQISEGLRELAYREHHNDKGARV